MKRLLQLSLQLNPRSGHSQNQAGLGNSTPLQAEHGVSPTADINTNMAKTKVVVTRQLIEEAQKLLDEKKESLEIVQWQSEKVRLDVKELKAQIANVHACSPATDLGSWKMSKAQLAY
jgi:hypothetical protein